MPRQTQRPSHPLGGYRWIYRDSGKENGNYHNGEYIGVIGVYKENGNYHNGGYIGGVTGEYMGIMEKNMETTIMVVI